MSRYQSNRRLIKNLYEPVSWEGYLYYVRLRTPVGLLYKIGYTKMSSVSERLAFKGDGAAEMIEESLFFEYFPNAWDLEQELHTLLRRKAAFSGFSSDMPLFMNGQSELYAEDVLEMDRSYSYRQTQETRDEIAVLAAIKCGADGAKVRQAMHKRREEDFLSKLRKEVEDRRDVPLNFVQRLIGGFLRGLFFLPHLGVRKLLETGNDRRLAELRIFLEEKALESSIERQMKFLTKQRNVEALKLSLKPENAKPPL